MVLYDFLLGLVLLLGAPWWLLRMLASPRHRAGLLQRLGAVPQQVAARAQAGQGARAIWVHAVSVGEVMVAARLIAGLEAAMAAGEIASGAIVLSTTTRAAQVLASERLAHLPIFYLPLDLGIIVRRYLTAIDPRLMITIESELWPRLIHECSRRGTALAVINARISDRSFPRYMRLRKLWQPLLRRIDLFLAQGDETARRLVAIGVPQQRVRVTGNLKYDVGSPAAEAERPLLQRLRGLLGDAPVVIAGSTLEGEEDLLLAAWPAIVAAVPGAVMILAPRHPQRFEAVAALVGRSVPGMQRASTLDASTWLAPGSVVLLDTIGDLAAMYELGAAAFVGGSLVAGGGHNPLEPARFGVPVLIGPDFRNFREIVAELRSHDAVQIVERAGLEQAIVTLLRDRAAASALGARGRQVFASQAGAVTRSVAALAALLRMQPQLQGAA